MTLFALLLTAVYLVLAVLIIVTMRASEAVFSRLPAWTLVLVYVGAAGLLVYTLSLGNVLAYIAAAVIAFGFGVYAIVVLLPKAVPYVGDVLKDAFTRSGRHHR